MTLPGIENVARKDHELFLRLLFQNEERAGLSNAIRMAADDRKKGDPHLFIARDQGGAVYGFKRRYDYKVAIERLAPLDPFGPYCGSSTQPITDAIVGRNMIIVVQTSDVDGVGRCWMFPGQTAHFRWIRFEADVSELTALAQRFGCNLARFLDSADGRTGLVFHRSRSIKPEQRALITAALREMEGGAR